MEGKGSWGRMDFQIRITEWDFKQKFFYKGIEIITSKNNFNKT